MAKKYLLYIHDDLFEKESHKSRLVNNLLERHYHDTVDGGKTQEVVNYAKNAEVDAAKLNNLSNNFVTEAKKRESDWVKKNTVVNEKIIPKELEPKFCKNGHPVPYPKDRCLGKGCKYS